MTKPKRTKKAVEEPGPSLTIRLQITIPPKVAWVASGFLTGSVTTEAIVRLLSSLHGG